MRLRIFFLFVALMFLISASYAVPPYINFQGLLKDSAGRAVSNNSQSIVFSIYPDQSTPSPLWSETQVVSVDAGQYSVRLGATTPLNPAIFDGSIRYIGIRVLPDAEMTPRLLMISVPYAFQAATAETVNNIRASATPSAGSLYPLDSNGCLSISKPSTGALVGGQNTGNGLGVYGSSVSGIGVSAESSSGIALAIKGQITASGCVGTDTITGSTKSVSNSFAKASSLIFLTVNSTNGDTEGGLRVSAKTTGSFTVTTTTGTAPSAPLQFNYLIIN